MNINHGMVKRSFRVLFKIVVLILMIFTSNLRAATLVETFENSANYNRSVSTISWLGYKTSSAIEISTETSNLYVSYGDYIGVKVESSITSIATFKSALNLDNVGSIAWKMNVASSSTTPTVRILLCTQNDGWIVSDEVFHPQYGADGTSANMGSYILNFTLEATSWRSVDFSSDNALSISSTTLIKDLSSSNMTAVGFYVEGSLGTVRIDDLIVTYSVPESSKSAMLISAIGFVFLIGRFRSFLVR